MTLILNGCGNSKLSSITSEDGNKYSCDYEGTTRSFLEYAPGSEARGILFMLHGHASTAEAFRSDVMIDEDACPRGYVTVYVTSDTDSWNSGIGDSDSDDIGFLKALAKYMQDKYDLNKENTFAAGFSNGAFMMYRLAIEGEDTFKGVASVAGMMPEAMWNNKKDTANISLLQINGSKDDVVPMNSNGSAKYSKAPAIEDVIEYFANANDLKDSKSESLSKKAELIKYYNNEKNNAVWHVLIKDGRHSWPDENICGFSTNSLILDFFDEINMK